MKIKLTLTEAQAEIVQNALDLYSRVGCGQFEEVERVYNGFFRNRNAEIEHHLRNAKCAAGHPKNGSFGIHNSEVPDKFRQAWDICQVVRNKTAWARNPAGGIQVQFDDPHRTGSEPLPLCEIVKEEKS